MIEFRENHSAPQRVIERETALYRQIPALLYAVFEEGKVVEISEQCFSVLGYQPSEMIGRPGLELFTAAARERVINVYLPELTATGQLREVECELVKKNGEVTSMFLTATAEHDAQGAITRILAMMTDGSQRRHAEHLLRTILEGTAALTGGDFFRSLVKQLAHAFQVMYVMVTECADERVTRLRTLACYKYEKFLEHFEYDLAGGPCEGVIKNGACYYPRLRDLFPREDQFSYLGVSIFDSKGNAIGHLVIEDDKPMRVGPYDLAILRLFAARAGVELERKRTEDALRQREEQLQRLNEQLRDSNHALEEMVRMRTREIERRRRVAESLRDMVLILNSAHSLNEILEHIVTTATQFLGAQGGAIFTLQSDQETLAIQSTYGLPEDYATNLLFPVDRSLLGQAIHSRTPKVFTDLASALSETNSPLDSDRRSVLTQRYRTMLTVPLLRQRTGDHAEEIYGGIALYYQAEYHFHEEEISLAVAFGAQATLAIENAMLRQRTQMSAVTDERNRLARDLHDSVMQQLYSMALLSEGRRRMVRNGNLEGIEEALLELGQLSQQALKEMRLLIYELRPPSLEQEGLLGALHRRIAAVEARAGIEVQIQADSTLHLPAALEEGLYRIALEALNNALKHAAATRVTIQIHCLAHQVRMTVADNGRGFDVQAVQARGGLGLTSMRERTTQVGGVFSVRSSPEEGTTIQVEIPTKQKTAGKES